MKLILFLGAGVSVPSGLPTAAALTAKLFEPRSGEDGITTRVRALLKLVNAYDAADIRRVGLAPTRDGFRSSGAIYRGNEPTYEDLFFLFEQITLWSVGLSDNSLTTPFMETIVREAGPLLEGKSLDARMCELSRAGRLGTALIESVVAEVLRLPYLRGLDLVVALARSPRVSQLNIVTLNHDTLVEQLLTANGVQVVDGFGGRDGNVRWSDDSVYDGRGKRVRLFKLHGSVDWYALQRDGGLHTAICEPGGIDLANAAGVRMVSEFRKPSFLSGLNKSVSYHRGIYADIHFRFAEALRECRHIIMSGYGWGDTAINFQLESWLDRSRKHCLTILHREPAELTGRSMIFASGFNAWRRSGQLVCIERWLEDVSLSDLKLG
jgi:hypothetical protein